MSRLTDSSEIREALGLFQDILQLQTEHDPAWTGEPFPETGIEPNGHQLPGETQDPFPIPARPPETTGISETVLPEPMEIEGEFRGDRLENLLFSMCRRGGFSGAVVSDRTGLPLAVYNSPVDGDTIAAFTSVLGDTLVKAGTFLGQHDAEYISMDINQTDKVVVRRFAFDEMEMFLMVLCPQDMDERAEVEVSIGQILSILG